MYYRNNPVRFGKYFWNWKIRKTCWETLPPKSIAFSQKIIIIAAAPRGVRAGRNRALSTLCCPLPRPRNNITYRVAPSESFRDALCGELFEPRFRLFQKRTFATQAAFSKAFWALHHRTAYIVQLCSYVVIINLNFATEPRWHGSTGNNLIDFRNAKATISQSWGTNSKFLIYLKHLGKRGPSPRSNDFLDDLSVLITQ